MQPAVDWRHAEAALRNRIVRKRACWELGNTIVVSPSSNLVIKRPHSLVENIKRAKVYPRLNLVETT